MSVLKNLIANLRGTPDAAKSRKGPEADEHHLSAEDIASLIGTKVNDPELFKLALRHRSLIRDQSDRLLASNERLEYLGDSVLGFVVADILYNRFPDREEGYLTRLRAKLVNGHHLADSARELDLGSLIQVGESLASEEDIDNESILADALEALIGALYLDSGLDEAREFIKRVVLSDLDLKKLAHRKDNHKSALLEYLQARGRGQPTYRVISETGPSHERRFEVGVYLQEDEYGRGKASSKKRAEQRAAQSALLRFKSSDKD